ncbi:MAG: hypothetical protein NW200_07395 [Hyphomonadaceae bacterium]|nr:hypothetical protein [Hyphomonadaceae bacterium]
MQVMRACALAACLAALALAPPARAQARDAIDFARAQRDCGKLAKVIADHPDSEYAARAREVMRAARCAAASPRQEPCAQARARWATLRGSASSAALRAFLAETPAECLAERDAAQSRLDALSAGAAPRPRPAETPRPTPPPARAPFDLALLHPSVRDAVQRARAEAARAETAAVRARDAAARAEDAAARARRGEPGTRVVSYSSGDRYEGEFANGARNGYGLYFSTGELGRGNRLAGLYGNGKRNGPGTMTFGQNAGNATNATLYEGDFVGGVPVVGVLAWSNGHRYAGSYRDGYKKGGVGIYVWPYGDRHEGEWANDRQHGYGVRWSGRGSIIDAGIFENGVLVTPLAP